MSGPAPIRDTLRSHWPKLLFSLLVAFGFWWLLRRGALPLMPSREALTRVSYTGVFAHFLIYAVMHLVRAGRWYWLLAAVQRVPLVTVMRSALLGFVAIVVMPFRMGEVVRPLLIRRDGRLSAWAASGTVGAERIIDGIWITGLLLVSLSLAKPVEPLPDRIGDLPVPTRLVPGAAYATAMVFVIAFALMALFYWRQRWARRTTEAVLGVLSPKLGGWVASRLEQVAGGLDFLKKPRFSGPFLAATTLYWGLNGLSWWVLAHAVGLSSITFMQACAVMGVVALGILVPNAPGFFGAFQLSIYAGLAMYLPRNEVLGPGAVYVFLTYLNQMGVILIFGGLATALPARVEPELSGEQREAL